MSNLPQTLQERTQFVLGALLATGITAPWMSAFAASPERFREFLRAHRRMSSLHIHPDVLEGDAPDTVGLKTLATPYFAAVDALLVMDDDELPNALRLFADRYGTPRAELLDKLQELISERSLFKDKAERDARELERAFAEKSKGVAQTLEAFGGFYAGHLNDFAPYALPEGGKTITLAALSGQFVASPVETDLEQEPGSEAATGRNVGYVSPDGVLYAEWLPDAPRSAPDLADAARAALLTKSGKPSESMNRGRLVALTNSEALEDPEVRDGLFPRGMSPSEVTFPSLPLQKLVNGLTGRLRQTEKHNDRARETAPAIEDYGVRRVILVAVQPDILKRDGRFAPDAFTLTVFPLALVLPAIVPPAAVSPTLGKPKD